MRVCTALSILCLVCVCVCYNAPMSREEMLVRRERAGLKATLDLMGQTPTTKETADVSGDYTFTSDHVQVATLNYPPYAFCEPGDIDPRGYVSDLMEQINKEMGGFVDSSEYAECLWLLSDRLHASLLCSALIIRFLQTVQSSNVPFMDLADDLPSTVDEGELREALTNVLDIDMSPVTELDFPQALLLRTLSIYLLWGAADPSEPLLSACLDLLHSYALVCLPPSAGVLCSLFMDMREHPADTVRPLMEGALSQLQGMDI
ncbi:hypothetical protein KIPB_009430 [Kipferlia bialata]|uniref:Uncharacterized protein n=1 Tax=Kipferlia bialata TaxID=797122 RepID=A0A9K3D3M7_9EUKA|nr:hypothetical protein KIPB_009430 [Kipferlia bialata]|eukprot:g9430.t1